MRQETPQNIREPCHKKCYNAPMHVLDKLIIAKNIAGNYNVLSDIVPGNEKHHALLSINH